MKNVKKASMEETPAKNRNNLEDDFLQIVENSNLPLFHSRSASKELERIPGLSQYILTNAPYKSIYGITSSKNEYVIVDGEKHIRIRSSFQTSSGSADEKYPFMLLNAIYAYPEQEVILLIDGGGYTPNARKWLKDRIDENWLGYRNTGKTIHLMDLSEFSAWFKQHFR